MSNLRDYYLQHMSIGEIWKVRDAVDANAAMAVELPASITTQIDSQDVSGKADLIRNDRPHGLNQSDKIGLESTTPAHLRELDLAISNCVQCDLCQRFGRNQISSRPKSTDILLISEFAAPMEYDVAEKLIQNLMLALSLPSHQKIHNVWRSSVLRACAPSSYNKDDVVQKAPICLSWLTQEIDLLQPRAILVLGNTIANTLLETDACSNSHGQPTRLSSYREIPLLATYSIAELLASPTLKAQVWARMCQLKDVFSTKSA